jgi:hypothetical protein
MNIIATWHGADIIEPDSHDQEYMDIFALKSKSCLYNISMCDTLKTCIKCNIKKQETEYPFRFKKLNIRHDTCKECKKQEEKLRRTIHKEVINKRLLDARRPHRKKLNEINRAYQKDPDNKLKISARRKLRKLEIKEAAKNGDLKCIQMVMKRTLRDRINKACKLNCVKKSTRSNELIGTTWDSCRQWIESQFKPGMSWSNHGINGWHIDHIRPCASFDLTDPAQQRQCFHYTNLQPLWAEDNRMKGSTVSPGSRVICVSDTAGRVP